MFNLTEEQTAIRLEEQVTCALSDWYVRHVTLVIQMNGRSRPAGLAQGTIVFCPKMTRQWLPVNRAASSSRRRCRTCDPNFLTLHRGKKVYRQY